MPQYAAERNSTLSLEYTLNSMTIRCQAWSQLIMYMYVYTHVKTSLQEPAKCIISRV